MTHVGDVWDTKDTNLQVSVVAGGATGYACVHLLHTLGITEAGKNVDSTVLSSMWAASKQTVQSATFTGSGFFDYYGDTTGQKYLMDNAITGAETWLKLFYGDGATDYVKSRVELTNFSITAKTAGEIEFSFTADSTGTITHGGV